MERLATAAMPALNSAMKKVLRTMEGLSHHAKGLGTLSQSLTSLGQQALPQLTSAAQTTQTALENMQASSGVFDQVQASVESLNEAISTKLNPSLEQTKSATQQMGTVPEGESTAEGTKKQTTSGGPFQALVNGAKKINEFKANCGEIKKAFTFLTTPIRKVAQGVKGFWDKLVNSKSASQGASLLGLLKDKMQGLLSANSVFSFLQRGFNLFLNTVKTGISNMAGAWPPLGEAMGNVQAGLSTLTNSFGAMVAPILMTVLPIFNQIIGVVITAANAVGMFFAKIFGGRSTYIKIGKAASGAAQGTAGVGNAAKAAAQDVEELDKATNTLGLDELNVVEQPEAKKSSGAPGGGGGGAGGAGGAMFEEVPIDNSISDFADTLLEKLEPTKMALAGLAEELARLGQFAWQGLVDFYNSFLVPVGEWVLSDGLPRFINTLTDGLAVIDWGNINGSLHGLWEALSPFAINMGEGLLWMWENVLVPLGSWTMNSLVPAFLDTLSTALETVNGIIEAMMPGFDAFLEEILKPLGEWAGSTVIEALGFLKEKLEDLGQWVETHQDAIEVLAKVIGIVATAVLGAKLAFFGLQLAVGFLTSPLGLIVTIITLLAAAFAYAWDQSETFRTAIQGFVDAVTSAISALMEGNWEEVGRFIVEGLFKGLSAIWELITTLWNGFIDLCKSLLGINSPSTVFAEVGDYLAQGLLQGFQVILDLLVAVWDGIVAGAQALWDGIVAIFMTVAEWFIASVVTPLLEVFSVLWETLKNLPAEAWLFIQETWLGVCEWFNTVIILPLVEFFSLLWETLKNLPAEAWLFIQETWLGVCEWFNTVIILPLLGFFSLLWETLKNLPAEAWLFIQETWLGVCEWFNTTVILPLQTFFSTALTSIGNFFSNAWTNIKTVWNTVTTWFNVHIINPVREAFSAMIDNVRGFFSGLIDFFKGLFHGDFEGAWNAICDIFGGIWDTMYGNMKGVINKIIGAVNKLIKGVEGGINWLIDGINKAFDFIRGIANGASGLLAKAGIEVEFTVPSFQHVTLGSIPLLASGAVLTQRTLFEGGEYPGARTNPEIVSPLSMMKGAFKQALAEQGGMGGSFTAEQPIELSLDGDVFYRAMVRIKQNRGVAIGSAFAEAY